MVSVDVVVQAAMAVGTVLDLGMGGERVR